MAGLEMALELYISLPRRPPNQWLDKLTEANTSCEADK